MADLHYYFKICQRKGIKDRKSQKETPYEETANVFKTDNAQEAGNTQGSISLLSVLYGPL